MSEAEQCSSKSVNNPDILVPKKGYYSEVWVYFGFKPEECSAIVSAPKGNTTNVFNHLKRNHIQQYEMVRKNKAITK